MPRYVRAHVPGGTFFFTIALARRGDDLLVREVDALRTAYAEVARDTPFRTEAVVILPDHLHAVWTLPEGDADFSTRWKRIKRGFTVRVAETRARSWSKRRKGEAGLWQRRFWERCVRDEAELAACLRYVWCNPVKHGLVQRAVEWPWSSVHREIAAGRLPAEGV